MGKIKKYKNVVERFLSGDSGQRFFNFAYSIGAAVVIWGALFKILHLQGGNELLTIGMGTEVLMFILTAFDSPQKQYHWEQVFPVLETGNPDDRPDFASGAGIVVGAGAASAAAAQQEQEAQVKAAVGLPQGLQLTEAETTSLSESIQRMSAATEQLSKMADLSEATSRYLGFVDRGTTYKAYSTDDMTYEHAISVYQLVDDTGEVPTPVVPVPTFSPAECEVEPGTEVTLTSGASALRYTTDGSDPSTSPTATQTTSVTTSVTLATTTTLKAVSVDASGNMSEVVAATYTVRSSQTIDLRNATGVLTFTDFRSFPTWYAGTDVTADAPASDGNTYPWTVKNVQVDTDGTLLFKASEGQMESLPVGSEHGFIVRVTYDISSTATVSLSVTGGSTVTNTTHYSDGRTQTIATSTPTPSGAVITLSSVKNSFSVSRIDLLPIDANGHPTAIADSPLLPSPTPLPAACYNLAGQRVHHPTRGLYIAGGKKVWIQ